MTIKKIKLYSSFVLFIGMSFFIYKNYAKFSNQIQFNLFYLLPLIAAHLTNTLLLGYIYKTPLKKLDIDLSANEWFGMTAFSNLFNIFLPAKGGTLLRWLYLKNKHNLQTKTFIHKNIFATVVGMFAMGSFGLVFLSFYFQNTILHQLLIAIFSLKIIFGFFLTLKYKGNNFYSNKVVLKVFLSFFLISTLYLVRLYFSTKAIGVSLSFIQLTEFSSIMLLVSLIPVLPGNLGIKELALGHISTHYGLSMEVGIIIGMIDRIALWSFIIPTGLYYYLNEFIMEGRKMSFSKIKYRYDIEKQQSV